MAFFDAYDIAGSGMAAQRTRISVTSTNIANAKTTRTEDGGPYKRKDVVFEEVLLKTLKDVNLSDEEKSKVAEKIKDFKNKMALSDPNNISARGVLVKEILDSKDQPIMKYDPSHPDSNEDGYVAYPNINPVIEMADLIEAMRSYEANLAAFTTTKTIDTKTLELLKA
jgi:flagellar basal-body rod protein FlgC